MIRPAISQTVLTAIVARRRSSAAPMRAIMCLTRRSEFACAHLRQSDDAISSEIGSHIRIARHVVGEQSRRMPIQIADMQTQSQFGRDLSASRGYRSLLIVPLLQRRTAIGRIVVRARSPAVRRQAYRICCRPSPIRP